VELELTADQEFFVETTRKYLSEKAPAADLRAMRDDPAGFSPEYWRQGAELGWTSLLVSEENGGGSISGRPIADLTLVAFEFGRHAAPGPLGPGAIVAGAISRRGDAAQRADLLPRLLAGGAIGAWAYAEPRPQQLGEVAVEAVVDGDTVRLTGIKAPVEAGGQADELLVTARTGDGLTQVLVPAGAPGVTVKPMGTVDLTRRFATISFDGVELPLSAVVGEVGAADPDVDWQLRVAIVLQLAEMVGARLAMA
jgi:alkylation response protein AidB-like acyl-CoA dehydrogenase